MSDVVAVIGLIVFAGFLYWLLKSFVDFDLRLVAENKYVLIESALLTKLSKELNIDLVYEKMFDNVTDRKKVRRELEDIIVKKYLTDLKQGVEK